VAQSFLCSSPDPLGHVEIKTGSLSMLQYEPPFLPDQDYIAELKAWGGRLHSLYFSLQDPRVSDARPRHEVRELEEIATGLAGLPGPKKYALLNSRVHCPTDYFSSAALSPIRKRLDALLESSVLDGIVYADHYLLQALSDEDPKLCSRLEAVPSINFLLDNLEKIQNHCEYISHTHFQAPGLLILDRSLNRSFSRLQKLTQDLRRKVPGIALGLLANEGCLPGCPFKLTHDAHISMANMGCGREMSSTSNQALGCSRYFREDPSLILRSPFIRPEDAEAYEGTLDFLKLSGRTRGARAMAKVVRHYLQGTYHGNLVELMDTLESMAQSFLVPNQNLPADFGSRTKDCRLHCSDCSYCRHLAESLVEPQPLPIKPMWA